MSERLWSGSGNPRQLTLHLRQQCLRVRRCDEVAFLVRIAGQIVQLVHAGQVAVLDVLRFARANRRVTHLQDPWKHGVAVVLDQKRVAPLSSHAVKDRRERSPLHPGKRLQAGKLQQCRRQIDRQHHLGRDDAGFDAGGIPHQQRNANRFLVRQPPLFVQSVLAVEVTVIAREHDHGVVEHAGFVERGGDPSEAVIHSEQHLRAATHLVVCGRGLASERRQVADAPHQRGLVHRRLERVRPARHHAVLVSPAMTLRRDEPARLSRHRAEAAVVPLHDVRVDGLVREIGEKRLAAGLLDELFDVIGEDVGDVPLGLEPCAVDVEMRIDRLALAGHRDPAREAGPRAVVVPHVPLAEEPGRVTGLLQLAGEGRQIVTRPRGVVDDAIGAGVLSREQAGAARRTQRRRRKRIHETDALARQSIHIRRLEDGMPRDAHLVPPHVVDDDEDDVRRARRRTPRH